MELKLKIRFGNEDDARFLRIKHYPNGHDGVEEDYYVNPAGDVEIEIRPESLVLIKGGISDVDDDEEEDEDRHNAGIGKMLEDEYKEREVVKDGGICDS